MSESNKLGPYIQKLMLLVVDKEQDSDVKQLAYDELKRLNDNVDEFLNTNKEDSFEKIQKKVINKQKQEKQLLQEDMDNVSDK
tara:strand:+ start:496 stop:744 length:249 start_codon:yes stop_codon:yes gene_type:complete